MTFIGISRTFSLIGEDQYNTIGAFWDEMSDIYGLESLEGLVIFAINKFSNGFDKAKRFLRYHSGAKSHI